MTYNHFKDIAPRMWDWNYRVLPIRPGTKQPPMKGWPGFASAVPNPDKQAEMIKEYPNFGTGVLLGTLVLPKQVLVAVDIDDDRLIRLGRVIFSGDLVGKRGARGETYFGLVADELKLKSTTLKGTDGVGHVDILAGGKQTVIDPSKHPDTGQPYTPVGRSITETPPSDLPRFHLNQIALLKLVLEARETAVLLSGEVTHDAGVALAAKLVRAGTEDDLIQGIFQALLPEAYDGDTLDELSEWISSAREKGFKAGDGKGNLTDRIVDIVVSEGVELFHSGEVSYAAVQNGQGFRNERIASSAFKRWVRHLIHKQLGKAVGFGPLNEAVATLDAMGQFQGSEHAVQMRVAGNDEAIEVDLGRPDGTVARVDQNGWRVEERPSYYFVRGAGFLPLPEPVRGGSLSELRDLLAIDEMNFRLVTAFLVNGLKPSGPYLCLLIEGAQGSGKSFLSQVVKSLLDPNQAMRMRLPDDERNLMVQAEQYRLLNFDNASVVRADLSDALCALATGAGYSVRRLYTDGELHVMTNSRPFILNGITGYASRPDLLERAIPLNLPSFAPGSRQTESQLLAKFEEIRPRVLGALFDAISAALRFWPEVGAPKDFRMADAARWITAAERGLDETPGTLIATVKEAQDNLAIDRVNDEVLVTRLRTMISRAPIEDYIGAIFDQLDTEHAHRGLPKNPSSFSKLLTRFAPSMEKAGLIVRFLGKDRIGRLIWIGTVEQDGQRGVRAATTAIDRSGRF